jgi:hypothetical protein
MCWSDPPDLWPSQKNGGKGRLIIKALEAGMMRARAIVLMCLGVAGCTPTMPDSGAGYGDYNSYLRNHSTGIAGGGANGAANAASPEFSVEGANAALDRAQGLQSDATTATATATGSQGAVIGAASTSAGYGGQNGQRARGNAPAGIHEETGEMVHAAGNTAISDEQDFSAVASRETIASDKERIARNRAHYQIDQPTAVPQRTGGEGVNIVQYAISANHPVGTMLYSRGSILPKNQAAACAKFASPDLAQQWFLENGGPAKDRRGLDPDGDGYACSWDPTPFRS